MKILDKIFKQLEVEAIPAEWYAYEIKRTNQIIRANVEPLEGKLKATAKICDIQEQQIKELKESKWDDTMVMEFVNWYIGLHNLGFNYTIENKTLLDDFKQALKK